MYVQVRLLKGFPKPLWYKTDNNLIEIGSVIQVPIRSQFAPAVVLKIFQTAPATLSFEIKEIVGQEAFPQDTLFKKFITNVAAHYFLDPFYFFQRIKTFLMSVTDEKSNKKKDKEEFLSVSDKILTSEQQQVVDAIVPQIKTHQFAPSLLHGVTGSGKTEVYKALIKEAFAQNKTTILLLPEVSLSMQFQRILSAELNKIPIFGFHSASKIKERRELWRALIAGEPIVIVGVHLPILLPISNLGLIIVDEEHEPGFIEKKHPRLNSKELAIWRAKLYDIPIILGSATPSLNTLFLAKTKNWQTFELKTRFAGAFPEILKVKLSTGDRRKNFWISRELEKEIRLCLERKEQVLIFINRRGFNFFIKCDGCSFVAKCPNCSVSLTPHTTEQSVVPDALVCHYCAHSEVVPQKCNNCSGKLLHKGIGTQQAQAILQQIFPQAKIARADLDTTKKRSWTQTLKDFESGNLDIMVGTQSIVKGYHFPKVTLVGVLWADLNLQMPVYNAAEITLQQLIQVAGRAGRESHTSKVIVQYLNDHYLFNFLDEMNYLNFYKDEIVFRQDANYPPFCRFVQIDLKNKDSCILDKESEQFAEILRVRAGIDISVLGPVKPPVYKIQQVEIRQIFLKSKNFSQLHEILKGVEFNEFSSQINISP